MGGCFLLGHPVSGFETVRMMSGEKFIKGDEVVPSSMSIAHSEG